MSATSSPPGSPAPSDQASLPPLRVSAPAYRFAFDRPRGPASVFSDANESRLDFSAAEQPHASQDVYASLQLSDPGNYTFAPSWSSSRHGFNAISTVLNNPKRSQPPLKANKAPLPPQISSDLPRIRRKDFDVYVNAITPAWEQFSRHAPQRTQSDLFLSSSVKGKIREIPPLSTVPPIFFDPLFDLRNPRTFASVTEQDSATNNDASSSSSHKPLNPEDISLNQVLQEKLSHYMDVVEQHLTREVQSRSTSFFAALSNLQDLQTEGADCLGRIGSLRRRLEEVDTNIARKGLQTIQLQERLSNLKTVEHATAALKEITDMLSMCDRLIMEANWDEALALLAVLEDVSSRKEGDSGAGIPTKPTSSTIGQQGLLSPKLTGDVSSLPSIAVPSSPRPAGKLSRSNSPRRSTSPLSHNDEVPLPPTAVSNSWTSPYSLATLPALMSLPSHIKEYRSKISSSLRASAIDLLRSDLIERFGISVSSSSGQSGGTSAEERIASQNAKLRQRFMPLWHGILRTGGVADALVSYQEIVLFEVKSCVRKSLPQKLDIDDDGETDSSRSPTMGERSAVLTQELRELSHESYLDLSRTLYAGITGLLEGIVEHIKLFNDAEVRDTNVSETLRTANQNALDTIVPDVLPAAAELANSRLSKVVMVRSDQHASLSLREFLVVFNEGWSFIIKCEVMARKMIVGLRGVMMSQAKAFLLAFHNARLSSSATLVENEQWAQVEVPASAQRWADLLVESAVGDPPDFVLYTPATPHPLNGHGPPGTSLARQGSSTSIAGATAGSAASGKSLLIEGRPYFVVSATLKVIEMLLDYMRVIVNLGLLTTEAMSRTIEYLKAYNSRTCQVVLGAGAMRSAGLKNITAKHLALASQSLSAMIALIPYVRETFRRHLNSKQAVMLIEFDKLKRDYHEHQNEIHSKLIAIMGDRLAFHCKTLHSINWDDAQPTESPNAYMRVLMKETLTLHKVLSKYLPTQAVELIMSQVFAAINHRLSEEYAKIDLPSQEAKDRLLQDARFLQRELSGLKDINMSNTMLETVVKEKSVRRKSPFATRRSSTMVTNGDSLSTPPATSLERRSSLFGTGPGADSTSSLLAPSSIASTPQPGGTSTTSLPLPEGADHNATHGANGDAGPSVPAKPANGGFREVIDVAGASKAAENHINSEERAPEPPAKEITEGSGALLPGETKEPAPESQSTLGQSLTGNSHEDVA